MPVEELIPEAELREALRPYRVDPAAFEQKTRERIEAKAREEQQDPLRNLSPWLQSAAALLPLSFLAGCKVSSPIAAKGMAGAGAKKLIGYLAFPAISLFVLVGAGIYSAIRVRSVMREPGAMVEDEVKALEAVYQWRRTYRWPSTGLFLTAVVLAMTGETWLLYPLFFVSFAVLLFLLSSLKPLGLVTRPVLVGTFLPVLLPIGQLAMFSGMGEREIHFIDQKAVGAVFLLGAIALIPFAAYPHGAAKHPQRRLLRGVWIGFMLVGIVPLSVWLLRPLLWPVTDGRIKNYVGKFDERPYPSIAWQKLEIVGSWAIDADLKTNFSRARRLLTNHLKSPPDHSVLNSAFRMGLVERKQLDQFEAYEQRRTLLNASIKTIADADRLGLPSHHLKTAPLQVRWDEWWIRAAVLEGDLSAEDRDYLEQRLLASMDALSTEKFPLLETALRATLLLEAIGRPVDREKYRGMIHDLLRRFHIAKAGWFMVSGGFKLYSNPDVWYGDDKATAHAVELMEIYGVPDGIDLNQVRSFLKPQVNGTHDRMITAVALKRLNSLPGVGRPGWLTVLYYERNLAAAIVLVGLCIYATLSAPRGYDGRGRAAPAG